MKKNILRKLLFVLFLYIIVFHTFILSTKVKTASANPPKMVFPVISDIHIGGLSANLKFEKTLNQCKKLYPNYDAIAIVGDITNEGKEGQYETFMKLLEASKVIKAESVIAMGNHEYGSENLTDKVYGNLFVKETRMPSEYYDKWIKGYHFIVLAPENRLEAKPSEEQLKWLNNKLKENEEISKPIFVFLHQPLYNTVYGSHSWGQVINYKKVFAILKDHPQVILFSGHSHYSLDHPNTMYKKSFTMFNTGAVYYIMAEDDKYCNYELNQGLVVEVYNEEVKIRCREFSKEQWIGKVYTVKFPHIPLNKIKGLPQNNGVMRSNHALI